MDFSIGIIGTGAMGGAIMRSVCKKFDVKKIRVTDKNAKMAQDFAKENGCIYEDSNSKVVKNSKYIFIAVKPQFIAEVFEEIKNDISKDSVVISMAAGVAISRLERLVKQ